MARVTVGVEVGHQKAPSAIAVVEAETRADGHHFVRSRTCREGGTPDQRLRKEVAYLEVSLGKAFLVTRLQTLLQTDRVHLPGSEAARILAEELLEYEGSGGRERQVRSRWGRRTIS